jgi:acyl carrier protein
MTKLKFYGLVEELLEIDAGSLKAEDALNSLPKWDSLALIGFIALLDQHFGLIVPASRITECKTVGELEALVADKFQ